MKKNDKGSKGSAKGNAAGSGAGRMSAVEASKARRKRAASEDPSFGATLLDWVKSILMGLLLFLVIRTLAIQTFTIISGSMENTFLIGDFIVVNKVAYGATIPGTDARLPGYAKPTRNDYVVFKSNHDDPPVSLIKRLVGIPGDTLAMKDGILIRNGQPQSEPYVKHTKPGEATLTSPFMEWQHNFLVKPDSLYSPQRDNWGPIVVPPDNYFMMGDNRDESFDSRFWSFVKKKEIIGRASIVYFSWDSKASGLHHIRWSRMGRHPR